MEKWQDPKVIAFWIAIIIVFIVTLLLFVVRILHAGYKRMTEANLRQARMQLDHQKKLIETNLRAQETERMRIASDLHDSLIGKLTVIRLRGQTGATTEDMSTMLEEGIAEARRISHDLTPPLLDYSRTEELFEEMLGPWQAKMQMDLYSDIRVESDLHGHIKIQLLRVMQELITNIVKHANATNVRVHLRHTPFGVCLTVRDNGKGFDTSVMKKGLGLGNLELRMQYLNAKYKVKSAPGKGTTTVIAAKLQNVS